MPTDERRLDLPVGASSVALARRAAADALDAWELDDLVDDILLLTSELVTNVVLHAGTPSVLVVRPRPRGIRLEVHDGERSLPVVKDYGATATTGRGLALVATLSDHWGADRTETGKVVWAEVTLPAPHGPARNGAAATTPGPLDVDDLDALEAALSGHTEDAP
jgi:anti-sigma regulatory factor (Ser/Thr protein kinase)